MTPLFWGHIAVKERNYEKLLFWIECKGIFGYDESKVRIFWAPPLGTEDTIE